METSSILGIHHVTAIAGAPQRNLDFYTQVLGLRLVKRTVNFDDPGTYHLYFGDELGRPGTVLTFFAWPGARRGRRGTGQATATAFAVPPGSIGFWRDRLRAAGVAADEPVERFAEETLAFLDPDGLRLELAAAPDGDGGHPWPGSPIPPERAIRGFAGVTLCEREAGRSARFLTESLGFRSAGRRGSRERFAIAGDGSCGWVDVVGDPEGSPGEIAAGTVHHVAWRVGSDEEERAWRDRLMEAGLPVSPVMDRQYFRSIYFREPGGVLFEIATDLPGFTRDETAAELGHELKLPPWLETRRSELEARLPQLELRSAAAARARR